MENALHLPLNMCSRYVIMSDCHRGEGTMNDNFLKNQNLYYAALESYYRNGFCYLELGDGEELWENRSASRIRECYGEIYRLFDCMERENRMVRLYGNHDMELADALPEALILMNQEGGKNICMIHGHQADFFNSVCWRLARFLVRWLWKPLERFGVSDPTSAARNYKKAVRYGHQADFFNSVCWRLARFLVRWLWKPLERFGVSDPTSAARNYKKAVRYERCLARWATERGEYLVAGHSHRPRIVQSGERESRYLNAGSCVHPGGVTAIEIEQMQMILVRWRLATRPDLSLCVMREVVDGPALVE